MNKEQSLEQIASAITITLNVLQDHIQYDNEDDEDSAEKVAYDKLTEALEALGRL